MKRAILLISLILAASYSYATNNNHPPRHKQPDVDVDVDVVSIQDQTQLQLQTQEQAQQQNANSNSTSFSEASDVNNEINVGGGTLTAGDAIINEGAVDFGQHNSTSDAYNGGNTVYTGRDINIERITTDKLEVEGVSAPVSSFTFDISKVRSDGPFGDDTVVTGGIRIPITWGLKSKDALSNARSMQIAKRLQIESEIALRTERQKQDLQEQAVKHQLEVDLLCHQLHIAGYKLVDNTSSPCYGKSYTDEHHEPEVAEVGSTRVPSH